MKNPNKPHVAQMPDAGAASLTVVSACPIFRGGISQMLGSLYPTRTLQALETLNEAVESIRAKAAGGVLIFADTSRPDEPFHDFNLLTEARGLNSWIVALTVARSEYVDSLLKRIGVARILELSASPEQLKDAIDAASAHEADSERGDQDRISRKRLLSGMEHLVLRGICDGLSLKEIAHSCEISAKTVSTYKNRIMSKLNVHTNVELIRLGGVVLAVDAVAPASFPGVQAIAAGSGGGVKGR